jgi:hypothetical protein
MRKFVLALALAAMCEAFTSVAIAEDAAKQLIGSWKVTSLILQVVGEQPSEPFGSDVKGTLVTTEGRWVLVITAANRKPATSNDERAALLSTLIAYTGKYTIEGDKITIKVEASWNELYAGPNQNQVRFFKIDGEKLTVRTAEQDSAVRPGKRVVATLTFEREH